MAYISEIDPSTLLRIRLQQLIEANENRRIEVEKHVRYILHSIYDRFDNNFLKFNLSSYVCQEEQCRRTVAVGSRQSIVGSRMKPIDLLSILYVYV